MAVDAEALKNPIQPTLRFFQWDKPTTSYGHTMSVENGIKRPSGGGIVHHKITDLSLSLVWPRGHNILPEKPRDCYEEIHKRLKSALEKWDPSLRLDLFVSCGPQARSGECFQEPVCNDLRAAGQKRVGGALRITKTAILYQGNILLESAARLDELKTAVAGEFN